MDLALKTTDDLEKLVTHLRRIGVVQYSANGVSLVLCEPQPEVERSPPVVEGRSRTLGLTESEQFDLFNAVVEAVPEVTT